MTGIEIRRARVADIPRILELLVLVNDVHADGRPDIFVRGRTKYTAAELEGIIADSNTPVFVCEEAGGPVAGYAFCRFERVAGGNNLRPQDDLYIDDICFDAPYRGRGLAARLFRAVEDFARGAGCSRVTLHVWECNPAAARFYAKCGMTPYFHALEKRLN
ncbi:MAG: GNAT family N-acetyltransferase [Kiritimatiellae bacterium]|nr:GNAT family N-acetyltransferase [Kiritimatiellia bacterium]